MAEAEGWWDLISFPWIVLWPVFPKDQTPTTAPSLAETPGCPFLSPVQPASLGSVSVPIAGLVEELGTGLAHLLSTFGAATGNSSTGHEELAGSRITEETSLWAWL